MTHPELQSLHHAATTINLDSQPLALRLRPGAAVFAVRGKVWLTQERMADDVILAAGERFDVRSRELLIVSATQGAADIHIVAPVDARAVNSRDLHDFLRTRAMQLRHEEIGRLANVLLGKIDGVLARTRSLLALRTRVAGH
jgi:hypothetical protein